MTVTYTDLDMFVSAYEKYEGDNVSYLLTRWVQFLNGEDTPCPESDTGLHQVTDGSCDLCGAKNMDGD